MNQDTILNALREHDGNKTAAARSLGIARQTMDAHLRRHGLPIDAGMLASVGSVTPRKVVKAKGRAFILTMAQNDTKVHERFWQNLLAFAESREAQIFVRKQYYDPGAGCTATRFKREEKPEPVWDPAVVPHLVDQDIQIGRDLVFVAGINQTMTTVNPLNGREMEPRGMHGVYAAPRIALRTVPTTDGQPPLIRVTTGAVTRRNYSYTDRGAKSDLHHVYAAAYIEVDDSGRTRFWHLIANTRSGAFHWLDERVEDGKITPNVPVEALVLGDLHAWSADPDVLDRTVGMIRMLRPKRLILHDLFDGHTISHHRKRNIMERKAQLQENCAGKLREELEMTGELARMLRDVAGSQCFVVASNHDEWLARYLDSDWRDMPIAESLQYLALATKAMEHQSKTGSPHGFNALEAMLPKMRGVQFLGRDDSLLVKGIELALHGDVGVGGSRGSAVQFQKFARKTVIGHSHAPQISGGCWQVGTMTPLSLPYSRGPSRWDNAHCAIYANGKRSLLFVS